MANIVWLSAGPIVEQWAATIEATVRDVAGYINSFLARPIKFDITLAFANIGGSTLATGGPETLHIGSNVWEPVGAYQSRTGQEVDGVDARLTFDIDNIVKLYFGPPAGLPKDLIDGFSVVVHEMLHGLGFIGWTDRSSYQSGAAYSPFDQKIIVVDGQPYFSGDNVVQLTGGPVPLHPGSVFHLHEEREDDLMTPYAKWGQVEPMSDLNLAILADLGIGTNRDDILRATAGADNIAGGGGFDTVIYDGLRVEYGVWWLGDGTISVGNPSGPRDLLSSIEKVQFSDGALIFDLDSANADSTYRMYAAAYGRTPDEDGLRFWVETLDRLDRDHAGIDKLDFLADQFLAADEYQFLFGASPSNHDYIDAMYINVLGRTPDHEGYAYWVESMEQGTGRDEILIAFSESPENRMNAAAHLDAGIWVV